MKLTNTMRDAFIRAAMDDVPKEDYVEQARDILQKHFASKLPPKLKAVYDDRELRQHLMTEWLIVADISGRYITAEKKVPADVTAKVKALSDKDKAQKKSRGDLEIKLRSTVYGLSTRKQLVEALPEFEKYAPTEFEAATPNLPAIANVVSAFVKAGWPKGDPKRRPVRTRPQDSTEAK